MSELDELAKLVKGKPDDPVREALWTRRHHAACGPALRNNRPCRCPDREGMPTRRSRAESAFNLANHMWGEGWLDALAAAEVARRKGAHNA